MLEKIVSEFQSILQKYLHSEKSLTLKMKKTLLVHLNEDSDDDDVNLSQQQKQLMQANLNFEKELLVDREQQFQKIETDIIDINQIMSEISTLVNGECQSPNTFSVHRLMNKCCSFFRTRWRHSVNWKFDFTSRRWCRRRRFWAAESCKLSAKIPTESFNNIYYRLDNRFNCRVFTVLKVEELKGFLLKSFPSQSCANDRLQFLNKKIFRCVSMKQVSPRLH